EGFLKLTGLPKGVACYYSPQAFEFYDRPVVTFHDAANADERFRMVGHEVTHQLEHVLWNGGDQKTLFDRPAWLTDGLAVFMSDGVDVSRRREGVLSFRVAGDRLASLKRTLAARPASLEAVTDMDIMQFMRDPELYGYAWSLVHYMTQSGAKL